MTDTRFKEIFNRNNGDKYQLCFEYYQEEAKGIKIDKNNFDEMFNLWLMFSRGDIINGISDVINKLKQKHSIK